MLCIHSVAACGLFVFIASWDGPGDALARQTVLGGSVPRFNSG